MSNNYINNLVSQMSQNKISTETIVSEVDQTLAVLKDYGIQKINLRSLGKQATKNLVSQIECLDVATHVSNNAEYAYYTTFNRISNDCELGKHAIKDSDVSAYRFMLIDIDPERPSGTCATEAEKQSAVSLADDILDWFITYEILNKDRVIIADSGNGIHFLVPLDFLPANTTKGKIKEILGLLDKKFSNQQAKIDVTVFNPSRITRLYGTLNCKGVNTPERPYRQSRLLYVPIEKVTGLKEENLNSLITQLQTAIVNYADESVKQKNEVSDVNPYILAKGEEWLKHYNLEFHSYKEDEHGTKLYPFKTCPMKEHSNTDSGACFTITKYGRCRFKCLHASCSSKTINDFISKYPCPEEFLLKESSTSRKEISTLEDLINGKKYNFGDYEVSKSGIYKLSDKKNEIISSTPFFISNSFFNIDTNHFQYELQYLNQDRKGTQKISASILSPYKISDLTKYGIMLASAPQKIIEYLNYQIKTVPIQNIHSYVGWKTNDSDTLTFRLDRNYGDTEVSILVDNSLFNLSSRGTFEEWRQMVLDNVLDSNMEIALCVGFSSIVLGYLAITDKPDIGSLIVNFYGQSTSGKTTALHLINSIYSSPVNNMYSFSATQNALLAILNENRGVVTTIDELSASRSTDLSELLYQIGQGRSRLRLSSSSTLSEQLRFNTVIATTSEVPMASYLNSNQGLHMRYIELSSEEAWTKNGAIADNIKLRCSQHYGVASDAFMEKIFKHEQGTGYIKKVYQIAYTELLEKLPESNFKTRICTLYAVIYSSAILVKELLDIDIDKKRVCEFLVKTEIETLDKRGEIPSDLYDKIVDYTLSHAGLFNIKDGYSTGGKKIGMIKAQKGMYRVYFFREEFVKMLKKEFSISNVEKAIQLLISQNKWIADKRRNVKYVTYENHKIAMYCLELPIHWRNFAIEAEIIKGY
ncbi:DUF927 domain-containing protein [Streptococcus sp. Marseille-P7375]|uniref:DUF927 domain-containing protein n=1 Tax=Streptococcus sp. Marseille-P7375 TaxID=2487318 RepID=UPI000B0A4186|nr:DUF927 domain-containing protein [Streptococcus sp. Marseille-P7375]